VGKKIAEKAVYRSVFLTTLVFWVPN